MAKLCWCMAGRLADDRPYRTVVIDTKNNVPFHHIQPLVLSAPLHVAVVFLIAVFALLERSQLESNQMVLSTTSAKIHRMEPYGTCDET